MEIETKVKINCDNEIKIEGNIFDLNYRKDRVKPNRSILSFTLISTNNDGKKSYPMPLEVFVYGTKADIVWGLINNEDLVKVSGCLRYVNGKGHVCIADHVSLNTAEYGIVTINVKHKEAPNEKTD